MTRSIWLALVAGGISVSTLVSAQVFAPAVPRTGPRDTAPRETPVLRIPIGTSSIGGTVMEAEGRPVGGAVVTVAGQAAGSAGENWMTRSVITDDNGAFSFPRLPAGSFLVSVSDDVRPDVNYGQRRPDGRGRAIKLADGQNIALTVPMPRGSAIIGTVLGPDGRPQRNIQVRAMRLDTSAGFKRLEQTGFAETDERGHYRVFDLRPGDYVVAATPRENQSGVSSEAEAIERAIASAPATAVTAVVPISIAHPESASMCCEYLPTYAPNAITAAEATVVTIGAGEERTGIDIRTRLVGASTIKGVVETRVDPGVTVQIWLHVEDPLADPSNMRGAQAGRDGTFVINGVAPGDYVVFAQTVLAPRTVTFDGISAQPQPAGALTDAQKMWGRARVSVNGEGTVSLNMMLQPARSISGVVVFDMKQPPDLTKTTWTVYATSPPFSQVYYSPTIEARVKPDGRFTLTGVPPGRYSFRANNGTLRSSIISGQETLDFPMEFTADRDLTDAVLTVTDYKVTLDGMLTDATGQAATDYTVIVAPVDNQYWTRGSRRIQTTEPSLGGKYAFSYLPPGSYFISVVTDLEPGKQYDPEFLRTIAQASVPVTITEGGKATQNLRVK